MPELVTALPKPGDIFDGSYRIECLLGRGQTSATFGAVLIVSGERCAVRCWLALDAGIAAAATREFMRVSRESGILAHPSIVEVFRVGEVEGLHYAVMEWLEGVSLPVYLEQHPAPLSLEETLALLLPCVDGLAEAHAAGIVHGDFRPENIFVCAPTADEPARARILHFGFSGTEGQPLGLPRPLSGHSRQFLSPEELRSDPLDERSDVYAIGVLFYLLLSGQYPFDAESMNDLALEIIAGAWTPLGEHVPRLAVGMEWVVEHAMATEPSERYQNLDELLRDLARFDLGVVLPQLTSERAWPPPAAALAVPVYQPNARDAAVLEQARRATARRNLVSRAGLLIGIVFAALLVRVLTAHERPLPRAAAGKRDEEVVVNTQPEALPRPGARGPAPESSEDVRVETATHAAIAQEARRSPPREERTAPQGDVHEPQILGTHEPTRPELSAPADGEAPAQAAPSPEPSSSAAPISKMVHAKRAAAPAPRVEPPPEAAPEAPPADRPRVVPAHDPLESMRLQ